MSNINLKKQIRPKLIKLRKNLSPQHIHRLSTIICHHIVSTSEFQTAHHLAFYMPKEGEVDLRPLIELAEDSGKSCYLPVLESQKLSFYCYKNNDPLIKNRYGIEEPQIQEKIPKNLEDLDLILMPLVAFDPKCHRIGYGAGYYDRTLHQKKKHSKPWLIGVGYEFQKVEDIIPDSWDIALNKIITEKTIYPENEKGVQ